MLFLFKKCKYLYLFTMQLKSTIYFYNLLIQYTRNKTNFNVNEKKKANMNLLHRLNDTVELDRRRENFGSFPRVKSLVWYGRKVGVVVIHNLSYMEQYCFGWVKTLKLDSMWTIRCDVGSTLANLFILSFHLHRWSLIRGPHCSFSS